MNSNFSNTRKPKFYPMAGAASITVPAGAAAWIDTDASATLGADPSKLWVFAVRAVAASGTYETGVRPHGSASVAVAFPFNSVTLMSYTDSAGHLDIKRHGLADIELSVMGYLK